MRIKIFQRLPFFAAAFFLLAASASAADFRLSSPAFQDGGSIPQEFTCDGKNMSPPLNWTSSPEGTQSFILIAGASGQAGWLLYNLAPMIGNLPKGFPPIRQLANSEMHGTNDFGKLGYSGPCPADGAQDFTFTLYALDHAPRLDSGLLKEEIRTVIEGHVLGEAKLTGRYEKKQPAIS